MLHVCVALAGILVLIVCVYLRVCGTDIVKVQGATGDYHTNVEAKGQALVDTLLSDGMRPGFMHVLLVHRGPLLWWRFS